MSKSILVAIAATAISIPACTTRSDKDPTAVTDALPTPATAADPEPDTPAAKPTPPPLAGPITDEARATALWKKMAGYKSWPAPSGLAGIRASDSVHGDFVRYFINGTAAADLAALPAGSILVKEGYRDDKGLLKAITAMERVSGYNPEVGDWFFVRFNDSGKATRINRGCASCHEDAGGGDFAFIND